MAMTFDATLKEMGRDSPQGFLATFDRPPTMPVRLLNVDLSTVTTAADLLVADLGVVPLAMLGKLPEEVSREDGLALIARQVVERLTREAPPERATKLLTDAFLLTGLRVRREVAARIFRGVRAMHESDTYLAILDEGEERFAREVILLQGEDRVGPPEESVRARLNTSTDLERLKRMVR